MNNFSANEDEPDEDAPKEEEVQLPEEPKGKAAPEQPEKKKGKKNHPEQVPRFPEYP